MKFHGSGVTQMAMTKGREVFCVAVLLAAVALATRTLVINAPDDLGMDFRVYQRVVTWPLSALYDDPGPMPFIYPPTAILPFKAVSLIGFVFWSAISALFFGAAVSAVAGRHVAAVSFLSQASVKGLVLGQVPMILTAGMFAGLRMAPFAGGALWGAVATIKPQLFLFAPLALIVRKDWLMLAGLLFGAGFLFLISFVAFGPGLWLEWVFAMANFTETRALGGATIKAITPAGIAVLAGYPSLPFLLSGAFLGAAAIIVSARRSEGLMLVGLIIAASLVASPYAHAHDSIGLIPICVLLVTRGNWIAAIPAAFIFIGTPILTMAGMMAFLAVSSLPANNTHRRWFEPAVGSAQLN